MKLGLSAALLLSASGCFYSFENPVELQDAGSIAGRVVFTGSNSAGLSPGDGQVGLLWTDLAIAVQDDGHFLFLGLPDGVYTLKYELDPGDGGLPLIAFMPGITLPQEPGNIPDAVDLGQIVLEPAARVTGHVTGLDGGPAVVGAFSQATDGGEIFESFTVMTDDGGNFTLDLPNGSHDIWASTSALSGSMPVTVPSGQVTDLGDLALSPPALGGSRGKHGPGSRADPSNGDPNGELVGDVVLGLPGFGAGASPGAVEDAGLVQSNVEINPPPPPQDPFALSDQVTGLGAHMDQTLPPGQLYPSIYCGLRGSQPPGPATLNDIGLNGIPTFVGHSTILGQITWLPVSTFAANGQVPPPDYSTSGTTGTGTGTSTGGTSTGGTSTGGTSTGGFPFQGWGDLAEGAVADAGTDYGDPFIPIPSAKGPMLFYTNNEALYLASSGDGGLIPVETLDNSGNFLALLAATTDERGVPSALINLYEPANAEDVMMVVQPGPDGQWSQTICLDQSYTNRGRALLLPAPAGSAEDGGPSLYAFFIDEVSMLNIAPVFPKGRAGCHPVIVNSPGSEDAGIGQWNALAGVSCILNGAPGACLALGGYGDLVSAVGIDLFSPPNSLADPLVLWSSDDQFEALGLSAVMTGPPGSELLTATWYVGQVDPVYGQLMAQGAPVDDLTTANPGSLPPALSIDAGYDPDSGVALYDFQNTLALSSADVPFVLAQGRANIIGNFEPPLLNFTFNLQNGAPFPSLPFAAGTLSDPSGYVDANGNPVVGLAADGLVLLDAQIWTYYP